MKARDAVIPVFIIVVIIQLFIPFNMLRSSEAVLNAGTAYKFRVGPVDPYDPFRGRYVILNFLDNELQMVDSTEWEFKQLAYVNFELDSAGYAIPKSIFRKMPSDGDAYLGVRLYTFYMENEEQQLQNFIVDYPFDRFYMDEFKAPIAEAEFANSFGDPDRQAYAVVYVKDGRGVIKDVEVDGVSLIELAEKAASKK